MIHALKADQFESLLGGRFEAFGGSVREEGVESRLLWLEHDPGEEGQFVRFPLRLTVVNGPGCATETGAIVPHGEPAARVSIRFAVIDLLRLLLEVEAYMNAYLAARIEEIRAERAAALDGRIAAKGAEMDTTASPSRSVVTIRDPDAPLSRAQRGYMLGLAKRRGIEDLDAYLGKPLDDLTKGEASAAIRALKTASSEDEASDWTADIHRLGAEKFGWDASRSESAVAKKLGKAFGELSEEQLRAAAEAMEKAPRKKAA